MDYVVLIYNLGQNLAQTAEELDSNLTYDMGDVGNEIGFALGKLVKNMNPYQINDFIKGFQHGVSLTNGTHP